MIVHSTYYRISILRIASILIAWTCWFSSPALAQVSVHDGGGTDPDVSSMLDVQADDSGVLIPRLTETQRNSIALPATSLLIFQTDNTPGYYYNSGTPGSPVWTRLFAGSGSPVTGTGQQTRVAFWSSANSLSSDADLYWDNSSKELGVGTATPQGTLEVVGDLWSTLSGDNALRIRPGMTAGNQYGFADQHGNIMALVNEQGTTVQAVVLGDVNPDNAATLFGVSVATGGSNPTSGAEAGWQSRFEVAGNGTVRLPTYADGLLKTSGGNGTLALATAADLPSGSTAYIWNQTGSDQAAGFRIDGNGLFNGGNVGVGTTGPLSRLHVVGTTGGDGTWNQGILVQNTNATAGEPTVAFRNSSTGSNYWFTGLNQNQHYDIGYGTSFTDGNLLVRIMSDGNVGVGTNAPTAKLHLLSAQQYPLNLVRTGNVGDLGIEFHDTDANAQAGYLTFEHADGSSEGNGASFHFKTTEPTLGVIIDGAGGYYAGTQVGIRSNGNSYLTGGNLGIGTTGPSEMLHISTNNDASIWLQADANNSGESNNPYIKITQDGQLVNSIIGMTGADGVDPEGNSYTSALNNGMLIGTTTTNAPLQLGTGNVARMTIATNGNVGIGLNNPSYHLHVSGRIRTNAINETSDQRLKKEVTDLDEALSKVLAMRGVNYRWRSDEFPEMELDTTLQFGLIAQELEKVVPELVHTDSEGWKTIEYSHLVPLLIEAIKEQQEVIARQEEMLTRHGSSLEELRSLRAEMDDIRDELQNVSTLGKGR